MSKLAWILFGANVLGGQTLPVQCEELTAGDFTKAMSPRLQDEFFGMSKQPLNTKQ